MSQFSDFRFGSNTNNHVLKAEDTGICHQYVPYCDFEASELPKIMEITNHDKRVYLKQKQLKVMQRQVEEDEMPHGFDSKRLLDLGVAPLQRIINELKSISAESTDDSYDKKVAKASGLINYCDYLTGKAPSLSGKGI